MIGVYQIISRLTIKEVSLVSCIEVYPDKNPFTNQVDKELFEIEAEAIDRTIRLLPSTEKPLEFWFNESVSSNTFYHEFGHIFDSALFAGTKSRLKWSIFLDRLPPIRGYPQGDHKEDIAGAYAIYVRYRLISNSPYYRKYQSRMRLPEQEQP